MERLNLKWVNDVIGETYKKWKLGDLILINAGTGAGKTYFIKNELNTYCRNNWKNILLLTNRDTLKEQVKHDIGDFSNITVMNYQAIETLIIKGVLDLSNFNYVVMDEAHYFFTDSAFNRKTDLFFKRMVENKTVIKVLMTATPNLLKYYLDENNIEMDYNYQVNKNYGYLNKIVCFKNYEAIDSIIEDIPQDEQILLFSSAKQSYDISKKYKGAFICSQYNNKFKKYIDYEELNNIITNGEYKNNLLCTTTALDNGINIKENSNVKHIIIDVLDRDEFIQCLGRRRIAEGEKINLYFYSWEDNKRIGGFRTKIQNSLDMANYLIENGEIKYTEHNFKTNIVDTRIIDDIVSDGIIHKVINECMYLKFKVNNSFYSSLTNKKIPLKFKDVISHNLGIESNKIIELETEVKIMDLIDVLESLIGQRLYKEQRKELIEFFNIRKDGKLLKSIRTLNSYLEEAKLPFMIISKKVKENNKLITIWTIEKLILKK